MIFVALSAGSMALAQSVGESKADPRIKAAMSSLGLDYHLLDDGAFQVTYRIDSARTQVAFINSWTDSLGKLEIREVTSTGFKTKGPLSKELANRLLRANNGQKLGAWRVFDEEGATYAVFAIELAASADAETLDLALQTVCVVADAMEQELMKKDEF
jgi:hypothetical protein